MKRLIAVFGVVLLVVTAIIPLGCARHNKTETFSDHGLSFQYPASYTVADEGREGKPNTESAGGLIVEKRTGRANADRLWLAWRSPSVAEEGVITDGVLAGYFGSMIREYRQLWEDKGYCSIHTGVTVEDSCSGHLMLQVYYEFSYPDLRKAHGTLGETYCSNSSRLFYFVTVGPHGDLESDAVDFLHVFTSSFVCH